MQTKVSLFFILFIIFQTKCQTNIKGVIKDTLGFSKDIHIINLNSKNGTFTNINGEFEILVNLGDRLQITSIQHETKIVTVANITLKNKFISIFLKLKIHQLEEFELKKHNLLGSLISDVKKVPIDNSKKFDAIGLGLPNANKKKLTPVERKLYTATTSNGVIPLDYILNVISGRLKIIKEEQTVVKQNNEAEYIYKNYKFIIRDHIKISEDDIYRFIYYCITDPLFDNKNLSDKFKMIDFFKEMAINFKLNSNIKID